jgi:hypothetical protein
MPKQVRSTARDVFFYLLMIVTLYISVISFITMLFQFVNILMPGPFEYFDGIYGALRAATAALFVSWPIYLFVSHITEKDISEAPEKLRLGIRRWLLYLTLFITAIVIIVDLIVLINEFMGGDFTVRFFLKTLSILLVAGAVFGYYLKALKDESKERGYLKVIAIIASIFAYAAIIGAFIAVGGPTKQRGLKFDQERVNNLISIQSQLTQYYQEKEVLPEALTDMTTGVSPYTPPTDPETEEAYIYKKTGELSFELCTNFAYEQTSAQNNRIYAPGGMQNEWSHPAGEYCFERTIDPDFFLDRKPTSPDLITY